MQGGSAYYNKQHGWDTTSHDYHSHVSRMERMPSVLTDVPHYPNLHMIFNNKKKVVYEEEENGNRPQQPPQLPPPQGNRPQQPPQLPPPQGQKKVVHFVEETIEIDKSGPKSEVCEKSIDDEADGFIKQRRKNFELCKWATFKP